MAARICIHSHASVTHMVRITRRQAISEDTLGRLGLHRRAEIEHQTMTTMMDDMMIGFRRVVRETSSPWNVIPITNPFGTISAPQRHMMIIDLPGVSSCFKPWAIGSHISESTYIADCSMRRQHKTLQTMSISAKSKCRTQTPKMKVARSKTIRTE